jgi:hypothetical protein
VEPVAAVDDDAVGRAGRAQHAVAAGVGDVDAVSRPGNRDRGALPVDEPIAAVAALEPIAAGAAVDAVVAAAAVDAVVAAAAADHVVAVAAADHVVAVAAVDAVVAAAAVEPLVAAPAMDQVGTTGAVDAGAMAVGAELIVAVAAEDPLAVAQPEYEVDTTGHPHKPPPQGAGDLRVTTHPGGGIEPQQPGRELVPVGARPRIPEHCRDGRPHTDHHRQGPNQRPCPAWESNREHASLLGRTATARGPRQAQTIRPPKPPPTAPTLPELEPRITGKRRRRPTRSACKAAKAQLVRSLAIGGARARD